jgi:hypothetical protein
MGDRKLPTPPAKHVVKPDPPPPPPPKRKVEAAIRINGYEIVSRAVEEGVRYGWNRAHKHTDAPDEETAVDVIHQAVINELCEVLTFTEEE